MSQIHLLDLKDEYWIDEIFKLRNLNSKFIFTYFRFSQTGMNKVLFNVIAETDEVCNQYRQEAIGCVVGS